MINLASLFQKFRNIVTIFEKEGDTLIRENDESEAKKLNFNCNYKCL